MVSTILENCVVNLSSNPALVESGVVQKITQTMKIEHATIKCSHSNLSCKLVAHSVTLDYGPTSRSQQNWPDINHKLTLENALLYAINNKVTKGRGKGFKRHLNKQLVVGVTRGPW